MRRSVLVTGASSGIGLATAVHLAELGFEVVGTARSPEKAEHLEKAAADAGVEVETLVLDVTDAAACEEAIGRRDLWGLVNNAGYTNAGAVEDVPSADAAVQLDTLVLAPMRLAQLVLPLMCHRGDGRIVNVSSIVTQGSAPMIGWYIAAKHALSAVTEALRAEVEQLGVEVVLIEPGAFRTDIWGKTKRDLEERRAGSRYAVGYDRALEIITASEPHMGEPAEVAFAIGTALTAGSPKARYQVGADTWAVQLAARLLPGRARDRLTRTALGL